MGRCSEGQRRVTRGSGQTSPRRNESQGERRRGLQDTRVACQVSRGRTPRSGRRVEAGPGGRREPSVRRGVAATRSSAADQAVRRERPGHLERGIWYTLGGTSCSRRSTSFLVLARTRTAGARKEGSLALQCKKPGRRTEWIDQSRVARGLTSAASGGDGARMRECAVEELSDECAARDSGRRERQARRPRGATDSCDFRGGSETFSRRFREGVTTGARQERGCEGSGLERSERQGLLRAVTHAA
jgi:hypothetical protein